MKKGVFQSEIIALKDVAQDVFLMRLNLPEIAVDAQAGNFVEIKVTDCAEVFWRRPISIHDADAARGTVDLLVKAVGNGTRGLHQMQVGYKIDVVGPLGNAFSAEPNTRTALMVAGGIGIAPFTLFNRFLLHKNIQPVLFYGMATSEQLCGVDLFEKDQLYLSTMDGSLGTKGLITEVMETYIHENDIANAQIFACGPTPMLKSVQQLAEKYDIPTQVSLETMMACGFGACVGCAVPLKNPQLGVKEFALACKDGPVFNIKEIVIDD